MIIITRTTLQTCKNDFEKLIKRDPILMLDMVSKFILNPH